MTEPKSHRRRLILRGLKGGLAVTQIARALQCSTAEVAQTMTLYAPELKVGKRQHDARRVAEVRRLWDAGVLVREIAETYGVTPATIRSLAHREGFPARPRGRPWKASRPVGSRPTLGG